MTPMKVGVVGSSHVGALKKVFDQDTAPEGMEFEFWALPGDFATVHTEDGWIRHAEEEKAERVNGPTRAFFPFKDFDAIVMVSEPAAVPKFVLQRFHHLSIGSYSDGFLRAAVRSWMSGRNTYGIIRTVRDTVPGPVLAVAAAFWREGAIRSEQLMHIGPNDFTRVNDAIADVLSEIGVTYVRQPSETLNKQGRTFDHLSRAHQFGEADDKNYDAAHMGNKYGKMMLRSVYEALIDASG